MLGDELVLLDDEDDEEDESDDDEHKCDGELGVDWGSSDSIFDIAHTPK